MTHVVVIGSTGHVGTYLVPRLVAAGYEVTAVSRGHGDDHNKVVADLSDEEAIVGLFDGLDVIIHLAASSSDRSPWERVLPHNIIATYNVFEEARRAGVKRIVFASSNHTNRNLT